MDFSGADGEVNAAQDLNRVLASRGDVEILDSKEGDMVSSLEPLGDSHYRRRRNYRGL